MLFYTCLYMEQCPLHTNRLILSSQPKVRRFSFSRMLRYHRTYTSCNHKDFNRKEEPKELLAIVTKVTALIFLVTFTDFLPFISKHGIDFTNMYLHLCGQLLAFFDKQFLYFLPVSIIDLHRHF